MLVIKPRFKDSLTAVAISWTTASHVNGRLNCLRNAHSVISYLESS